MKGKKWAPEVVAILREMYSDRRYSMDDIVLATGYSTFGIRHMARKLGLESKFSNVPNEIIRIEHEIAFIRVGSVHGNLECLIDPADVPLFFGFEAGWRAHFQRDRYYVISSSRPRSNLHRFLLSEPDGLYVDHKNGDGLDNRRSNIRVATPAQNRYNSRYQNKTGYKGVWFHKLSGLYGGAVLHPCGKRKSIGYYRTAEDAARAHDAVVSELHGEFAFLNFPKPDDSQAYLRRAA